MSFFDTGNPVPSNDPRDLDDNAMHIDEIANSTSPTFVDRLGATRKTLAGIEADANAILLRSNLADTVDFENGASLIGRGIQVVTSIAELRTVPQTGASKYVEVVGIGLFTRVLSGSENGYTIIVADDGGVWDLVQPARTLAVAVGQPAILTNTGMRLDYPYNNIIKNSGFFVWHATGPAPMATSIAENTNAIVNAQWRMEAVGTGTSIASIQKITSSEGGLQFTATFGPTLGFAYVRQNCIGAQSFSGRTFTTTVDVEVDVACDLDFYVRIRLNASNLDVDRPLVADSNNVSLPVGRSTVALTMLCPDVSSRIGDENAQNSLEYAFRLNGQSKVVVCKVHGVTIVPGEIPAGAGSTDPVRDLSDADIQWESGTSSIVGLNTTSGQKRLTVQYRASKYRVGLLTIADIVGNVGKISTYDVAGVRTDNITPTAISQNLNDFQVILNASTAGGIGVQYTINCYF